MRRLLYPALFAACLLAPPLAAEAGAQTTFQNRATFASAFTTTGENDLDGIDPGDPADPAYVPPTSITVNYPGTTAGTLGDPNATPGGFPTSFFGQSPTRSGNSWQVNDGGVTRLTFVNPVAGFGALFDNFASIDDVVFQFFLGGAQVGGDVLLLAEFDPYTGFFGVQAPGAFDRLDITAASGEFFEMDDLIVGVGALNTVPEPSTAALAAAGVLAVAGLGRGARRREARDV